MSISCAATTVAPPLIRDVVAAVLTHGSRVCMLRRSHHVHTDAGLWHCVTGYLPRRSDPKSHILLEIAEELGIAPLELRLQGRSLINLGGDACGWRVHAFHFECCHDDVTLNWEHDSVVWLQPDQISTLSTVPWLGSIFNALKPTLPGVPAMRAAIEA